MAQEPENAPSIWARLGDALSDAVTTVANVVTGAPEDELDDKTKKTGPAPDAKAAPSADADAPKSKTGPQAPSQRPNLQERRIDVDGVRVYGVERPSNGRGDERRAVILIHGAGLDHRDWTFDFIHRIDPAWRVFAFDRPGFGRSSRSARFGAAMPSAQAHALSAAARAFGVHEAVPIGHSWGGAAALSWALESEPEKTREAAGPGMPAPAIGAACIAAAVTPWGAATDWRTGFSLQETARAAFGFGDLTAATEAALAATFAPDRPPEGYLAHVRTVVDPTTYAFTGPGAAAIADMAVLRGALSGMTSRYPAMTLPVALIFGAADSVIDSAEQAAVADSMRHAALTMLPEIGHMAHHSAPDAVLSAISDLLKKAAPSH